VLIYGFEPGRRYQVQWWDTRQPALSSQIKMVEHVLARQDGTIKLEVAGLQDDVAVKIKNIIPVFLPVAIGKP
jgi:hypothetical protein